MSLVLNNSKIEVSVALCTFNREERLSAAVQNYVNQSFEHKELIIVNDGSTDNTKVKLRDIILRFPNENIRVFSHSENKGLAEARNTAILKSKGKFFTFCDDDDKWHKDLLKVFVSVSRNHHPNTFFTFANAYLSSKGKLRYRIGDYSEKLTDLFEKGFTPPVGSQLYPVRLLRKCGGYNGAIKSGVDHDLWIRLLKVNPHVVHIPFPYVYPNIDNDRTRMTLNLEKRLSGIEQSLIVWKEDIVNAYDLELYNDFAHNYRFYIAKKFIIKTIRDRNLAKTKILLKFFALNLLFRHILRSILKLHNKEKLYPLFYLR